MTPNQIASQKAKIAKLEYQVLKAKNNLDKYTDLVNKAQEQWNTLSDELDQLNKPLTPFIVVTKVA